jgi:chaperonin GroES
MEEQKFELEPLFDAVIVKPLEIEEKKFGNIIVPDIGKDRNEHGIVVAIGPGRHVAGLGWIPTILQPGDTVILPTVGFTKLQHEGEDYLIGNETLVLSKIIK